MGFNVIDQVIVGLLGADAVAAVGLSNSIASIALLLYASAGVGAGVMVAHAFGRKDLKEVSQIASTGQGLSGLLGLITAFLLIHPAITKRSMLGVDPAPLWQQKGRTLGLATAWFKGRHHCGQAPALDRADRTFRSTVGHEHVHLCSSVHPPGHHEVSS
jgi:Na+-driven multidrug efflux pump